MFDTTNKIVMTQTVRSKDSGYRTDMRGGYNGTYSNRSLSIGISQKRDADKERSFHRERRIYWGISSLGLKWNSIFSKYRHSSIVLSPSYHSVGGNKIGMVSISRINELYGGEEKLFAFPQTQTAISIRDESDLILTELAKIRENFGKKLFVNAYELAQHTFDESDKEWEEYLKEERKRQAILDES